MILTRWSVDIVVVEGNHRSFLYHIRFLKRIWNRSWTWSRWQVQLSFRIPEKYQICENYVEINCYGHCFEFTLDQPDSYWFSHLSWNNYLLDLSILDLEVWLLYILTMNVAYAILVITLISKSESCSSNLLV